MQGNDDDRRSGKKAPGEGMNLPALLTAENDTEERWAKENPKGIAARVMTAREEGYVCLTPIQRQFALEFVLSGTTLKRIAQVMDIPRPIIQRMYNDPIVRAYISDFQKEVAAHRLVNDQWVENQIMRNMPKLLGEEPVDIVTSKGTHIRHKKYHGAEIVSLIKHFSGTQEQKNTGGGVNVSINFAEMGITPRQQSQVNVILQGSDDDDS